VELFAVPWEFSMQRNEAELAVAVLVRLDHQIRAVLQEGSTALRYPPVLW
jgi:hypothetical protein